jgi:hypothetical protein
MTDIATLGVHAQTLIRRLVAPAQWHSVWIRAETDEDGRATGKHELCVSVRPEKLKQVKVPKEHQGIPVVQVPWPEEG